MRDGTCSKCASQNVHGARQRFSWGDTSGVYVTTSFATRSSEVDTYICTTCGYFEHYLADPEKLVEVNTAWGKVEPSQGP